MVKLETFNFETKVRFLAGVQIMGKIDKKRKRLQDRLKELEDEMYMNLKQKTSSTAEISLSEYQRKIADVRKQLASIA